MRTQKQASKSERETFDDEKVKEPVVETQKQASKSSREAFDGKIAIAIAISTVVISGVQLYSEHQNRKHSLLADYFDDMVQLQLDNELISQLSKQPTKGSPTDHDAVRDLARAKTLITLNQLEGDGRLKGQLLKFLAEAELVTGLCQNHSGALEDSTCTSEPILSLKDAKLTGVELAPPLPMKGVDLRDASLDGAKLEGSDLRDANLVGASLTDANLSGSFMNNADMQGANLTRVNLQEADLRGANLEKVNLEGAVLRGAKYDDVTTFPNGFDTDQAGMRHCSTGDMKCE